MVQLLLIHFFLFLDTNIILDVLPVEAVLDFEAYHQRPGNVSMSNA